MRFIAETVWKQTAIDKVLAHDLTMEDVEEALDTAFGESTSRSSGRPIRFGWSIDGRKVAVVFEWVGSATVLIVTAYEVD